MAEHKQLKICDGYETNLVTCVGCCHMEYRCYELNWLIETPIRLKAKSGFPHKDEEGQPITSMYPGTPVPPLTSVLMFTEGIECIESNFQESLEKFNEIIKNNTERFEKELKEKSLEEISKGKGFIGKTNGKIGCLLYSHENEDKSYRPHHCLTYICGLAKYNREDTEKTIKKFLQENKDNPKLNTLSYSRMIHLLDHHKDILLKLNLRTDFSSDPIKSQLEKLNKLFEIVTK